MQVRHMAARWDSPARLEGLQPGCRTVPTSISTPCVIFHIGWLTLALKDVAMILAEQSIGAQTARMRLSCMLSA